MRPPWRRISSSWSISELRVPKSTPIFYRVSASLLTGEETVDVSGTHSSGEVEPVLLSCEGRVWLGVGSDHTDRKAETIEITLSKQLCAKPVSRECWALDEVEDHWDQLIIRSYAIKAGERRLYQEGPLARMRTPQDLLSRYLGPLASGQGKALPEATAMFCGTMAVHGAIEPADAYELELEDPTLGRHIRHSYAVRSLPVEG